LFVIFRANNTNSLILYVFLFSLGSALGIELLLITEMHKFYNDKLENIKKIFLSGSFSAFFTCILGGSFLILVWDIQNSILFILFFKFLIFCRWADLRKHKI
jgi:hypothetical protein